MKCLIRKCSEDYYWYKDKVGEYFSVLHTEEYLKKGRHSVIMIDHPKNDESFTTCIVKEDCLVFRDEDMDQVKAAFESLENTLQKLSL